jgi:hypothetical protein
MITMNNRGLIILFAIFCLAACKGRESGFFKSADGMYGLKREGRIVVPPRFHMVTDFLGCCAYVVDDTGWTAIDAEGKTRFRPFVIDNHPDGFKGNRARFQANGLIGYYDSTFKVRIPAAYDFAEPFDGGLAKICMGCGKVRDGEYHLVVSGKWGFIDTTGSPIIEPKYDAAIGFQAGTFILMEKGDTVRLADPRKPE